MAAATLAARLVDGQLYFRLGIAVFYRINCSLAKM